MTPLGDAGRAPVVLDVAARTDVGRQRPHNEDCYVVADLSLDLTEGGLPDPMRSFAPGATERIEVGPKGLLLMVADGMGGANAGEVASRMAVTGVYEELVTHWVAEAESSPRVLAARLVTAVEEVSARIYERARKDPECSGKGTTATVACVLDGILYVAQVGDSRAYLVQSGSAVQLTRDQSVAERLVQAGQLTPDQAAREPSRSILLQAMGSAPTIKVDITHQGLRRHDKVVLCSDGLSGLVSTEEIAAETERIPDLGAAAAELVDVANRRGGNDNITVMIARVDGPALEPPLEDDQVGHFPYPLDSH